METMGIKEAAEALRVHPRHIYRMEERGQLRIIRHPFYVKGRVQIPREDIERLLAQFTTHVA